MRHGRGFTLVELMVTIVVFSILMTVGLPASVELVRNNRITTQTNELVTALNLARSEAVKRGARVQVAVQEPEEDESGWTAVVSIVGADEPLRVINRPGSRVTVNEATIVFAPNGTRFSPAAAFDLQPVNECTGMYRRQIAVAISGRITTTRLNCV